MERDFRSLKSIDLDLRPIHHHIESRVRAHVFICMLAAYLVWHLRAAWAPLTYTDEHRPDPVDPVAPARRSQAADAKAATKTTTDDLPARSFTGLLAHLATLTRNHLRVAGHDESGFDLLAVPTLTQRVAFELLGAAIPLTLKERCDEIALRLNTKPRKTLNWQTPRHRASGAERRRLAPLRESGRIRAQWVRSCLGWPVADRVPGGGSGASGGA